MRRPPQQSHFSLSTGNSLTSLDRLPADGEEEPAEQTPTAEQTRGKRLVGIIIIIIISWSDL